MNEKPTQIDYNRKARVPVAFLGILLILIGQTIAFAVSFSNLTFPSAAIYFIVTGTALFVSSFFIRVNPKMQAWFERITIPQSVNWIVAAVLISATAVFAIAMNMKYGQTTYAPVLICWFASGLIYLCAFRIQFPSVKGIQAWGREHQTELFVLGGITLLAAILRLYQLGNYPRVIDGDEGLMGEFAKSTIAGDYSNPFALWENIGALYLQAINLAIQVFGSTGFALRILPAISGILAIPALYIFSRHLAGRRIATISSFLLAVSHAHVNYSRIGSVGYIHGTWMVPLELYLLLAGMEKRKSWMAAAGGILLAIHFSVYLTSQLILGLVIVFMLLALIFMRQWFIPKVRQAGAFFGGFAIMILPELYYAIRNPNAFFDRLIQNGTVQTGWLNQTMAADHQSAVQVLGGRMLHVFLSIFFYPARDYYGTNLPLLSIFLGAFFLAGLGIALSRIREPGMLLLNGYLWAPVVAIGAMSIPPSADSYRILIALPPAILMASIAFDKFLEAVGIGWKTSRNTNIFITSGFLLSIAIFSIWAYFGSFLGQCKYIDPVSRFASYLGEESGALKPGTTVYLLSDATYFYGSHPSTDYLKGETTIKNVSDPVDTWQGFSGNVLMANPNRIGELETWIYAHPGGQVNYFYDCKSLILLSYHLP